MNKRQKLVQQQFLNNEEGVIRRLNQVYSQSLTDITGTIKNLEFTIGGLQQKYDWLDDDDPEKAKIRSQIQAKIYQKQYQEQLRAQVDGVLKQMQAQSYLTVSDYLDECYTDGFIGTIFDAHGQGVPIVTPINQESMVRAVQLESKISKGLYTRLGEDVDLLKKKITAQVSRSISTGMTYAQTAKGLENYTRIGYNNAIRIARTEGHRIQTTATMDAMTAAKDKGADVVKQWDSTLDGRTRDSHAAVDGEIRELNKSFSNGLDFPGDPDGQAAEVINCRCALLQRARWALDDDDKSFTKFNNFTKQVETFDSPDDYGEFKKAFFSPENKRYMNYVQQMEGKYGTKDFPKVLDRMSDREYKHYSKLLSGNPIYNTKSQPAFTPATVGDFPEVFRKSAQGKKATATLVDALNGADELDPNIRKLYTQMGDLPHIPWDGKVSYTESDHALSRWESTYSGETTKYALKIPKMQGDDLMGQRCTSFHEIGHFIDMGAGDKKRLRSQLCGDLTDAIKKSGSTMSKEVKSLFDDFASQHSAMQATLTAKYKSRRSDLTTKYMDGIISYDEYRKQWKAITKEHNAEADYLARNLCGGGVDMLSDIYDALSGGTYRDSQTLIFGHGGQYYSKTGKANSEIFANYMSLSVNRPDLVEMLRRDKPDLCAILDKLIGEMAGEIK